MQTFTLILGFFSLIIVMIAVVSCAVVNLRPFTAPHNTRYTQTCVVKCKIKGTCNTMSNEQANNPLHGITLEMVVTQLHERYGWDGLAYRIDINCFKSNPSIKSSLKFLRRTPWARGKVENLYIATFAKKPHQPKPE